MTHWNLNRLSLTTGVELDVAVAGRASDPAVILLHGFPESHRTWREIIPDLARDHFVLAPDQRGYAGSSKPLGVESYTVDRIVEDLIALADHFSIARFTLVGHDWGGAISWMAALQHPDRVERLVIINAPHPYVFQKSLFENAEQRIASQYITAFRSPNIEHDIEAIGLDELFSRTFSHHGIAKIDADERARYIDQWRQPGALRSMLNWYRASEIQVPAVNDDDPPRPTFIDRPFPSVQQPVLAIWGLNDVALLPCQLDGLPEVVSDLTVAEVQGGHFVPWENAPAVVRAMRDWSI